jgi:hypothetical protein
LTEEAHYEPPPDYSKAVDAGQAGGMFKGLFNATMADQPVPPAPDTEPAQPTREPPPRRTQQEPEEPAGYQPPPRIDATGHEEIEAPAEAGAESDQDADAEAGADTPRPPQLPPGLSKAEQERFLALPPEAQAFIAERERDRNNARSAEGREAAEARRAREAVDQERAYYAQHLKTVLDRANSVFADKWAKVDWKAEAEKDPLNYIKLRSEYDADMATRRELEEHNRVVQLREQQEAERRMAAHLASEYEKLQKLIPDMADGRKRDKLMRDLRQTVLDHGFEPEVADGIADARMLHIVHKAMLWDRAQKARAEAEKNPPPRPIRAGNGAPTPQVQRRNAATERLRRSGRIEDAADAFKGLLG